MKYDQECNVDQVSNRTVISKYILAKVTSLNKECKTTPFLASNNLVARLEAISLDNLRIDGSRKKMANRDGVGKVLNRLNTRVNADLRAQKSLIDPNWL